MKVTFGGHEVMTYMGYIDTGTGRTLTCEPGGTYEIIPEVLPTDGRLAEIPPEETKSGVKSATTDAVSGGEE